MKPLRWWRLNTFLGLFALVGCLQTHLLRKDLPKKDPREVQVQETFAPFESQIELERQLNIGVPFESMPLDRIGQGPIWQSVLMPAKDKILGEADLLVGLQDKFGGTGKAFLNADLCEKVAATAQSSTKLKNLKISTKVANQMDSRALFFVFQKSNNELIAVGKFSKQIEQNCLLPLSDYVVVSGHGAQRQEIEVLKDSDFKVVFDIPKGKISVKGMPNRSLVFRIGSKSSIAANGPMLGSEKWFFGNDLFSVSSSTTPFLGVSAYLKTSFLLEDFAFEILMDPGSYQAIGYDPMTNQMCTSEIQVKLDQTSEFKCPMPSMASISAAKVQRMDGTFWPRSFSESLRFRRWLALGGYNWILKSQQKISGRSNLREFSFESLLKSSGGTSVVGGGSFLGVFSDSVGLDDLQKVQYARVANLSNARRIQNVLEFYQEHADASIFPLVGTGEPEWAQYGFPFLLQTRYLGDSTPWEPLESFVTNGTTIEFLDPSPLERGKTLKMPLQKKFRIRVSYPVLFPPGVVEIYVNQKLYRRWNTQVNAGEPKDGIGFFEIDQKIDLEKDFTLSVAAWGTDHLPQILSGPFGLPPFALTRTYCVDSNENNLCEANN